MVMVLQHWQYKIRSGSRRGGRDCQIKQQFINPHLGIGHGKEAQFWRGRVVSRGNTGEFMGDDTLENGCCPSTSTLHPTHCWSIGFRECRDPGGQSRKDWDEDKGSLFLLCHQHLIHILYCTQYNLYNLECVSKVLKWNLPSPALPVVADPCEQGWGLPGSRNRCNLNGELFVAPVCVLSRSPTMVPGDGAGKYGLRTPTDRGYPMQWHMATKVTQILKRKQNGIKLASQVKVLFQVRIIVQYPGNHGFDDWTTCCPQRRITCVHWWAILLGASPNNQIRSLWHFPFPCLLEYMFSVQGKNSVLGMLSQKLQSSQYEMI